jgi:hypothetical protein
MKVNLILDENNLIKGFSIIPFDSTLPTIEVDDPYKDIQVGVDSFVNNELVRGTSKEDNFRKILELKKKLAESDYKLMKYLEGELTEEEYLPIKEQRKRWRKEINELEEN